MNHFDKRLAESESADSARDSSREALVAAWLHHFGVAFAEELDLGTLEMLGQLVRDGCSPPSRAP